MIIKLSEKNKDFFKQVYLVVQEIPHGRVTSYGAIANYLGAKKSSRMVGWAMNASHRKANIPAHRVVNRIGVLTGKGHFMESESDIDRMENLLKAEGIEVKNDKVQDFKKLFWDPMIELKDF